MVFPKPTELAILTVNGVNYQNWESVQVRHALREQPPYTCRFTCSEGVPIANNFGVLRIKPGDECTVTLAGFPAFKGKVETRQVYYDAQRHHIEIQCATFVEVASTSVIHKTMEWKDKTFQQIGQDVLKTLGINMVFEGGAPPSDKYKRVSATPGETIHDFLDGLARSIKTATGVGVSFTTNNNADFVVVMGPNGGADFITEGKDILIGREIIYNPSMSGRMPALTQGPGDDEKNGAEVASGMFFQKEIETLGAKSAGGVIRHELATTNKDELSGRAGTEGQWLQNDQITVIATVQGWLRPSGGLWYRDQNVFVTSPMLIMNGEPLILKAVTFSQDNATGTRTTLELANPNAIGRLNPPVQ